MAARKGKCIQFGGCSVADAKEVVDLQAGEEFVCKECGKPLQEIQEAGSGGSRKRLLIIAAALVVITAGVATWLFWPKSRYPEEPPSTAAPADSAKREIRDIPPATSPPSTDASTPCGLKPVTQPDVNRLLTYLKQGMNYATQNRYDLALNEFEQVRQIDPNFLAMHENIAAAELKLKKFSESENQLGEELKLIGCFDQMNDADLPKFAYMLEVGQDASNPNLARTQVMRKRIKQACGAAHYNLACIRSHQGMTEQALAELRQAVESGFCDVSALRRDPDLAKVRAARGFQEVLDAASAKRETP
jgi:hypothetical protein